LLFYIKGKHVKSVVCFTFAIFSKEFALLLPLIFLFYDYRLQQKKFSFSIYIPYLIPIVSYLALRSLAVQKANFLESFRFSSQLLVTPYLAVRYLLNMIYPFQLKVMYDESTTIYIGILCLLVIILLTGAIFFFRKQKELQISAFWFLLFLLPVVNIIPLHTNTLIADRYAYFSLMGFALALATIICKRNGRVITVAVVLLCTLYILTDFRQNDVWKDDETLFTRMAKDAPEMFIGNRNLGLYYYNKGDMANALRNLAIACTKPDIPPLYLTGAASMFVEANKPDEAEKLLFMSMKRDPTNPEPYILLKMIYEQKGNRELSGSYLVKARESIPGFEKELVYMAEDFSREGEKFIAERKHNNAKNILWRALLVKPDYVPALVAMGRLDYEQGNFMNARRHFEKVITLDPSNKSAYYYLSLVNQKMGNAEKAQDEKNR